MMTPDVAGFQCIAIPEYVVAFALFWTFAKFNQFTSFAAIRCVFVKLLNFIFSDDRAPEFLCPMACC